ncbi:MAG: beta-L-arabinofuranosidase domain-containing protein, partial [Planctomycetota bacterium]
MPGMRRIANTTLRMPQETCVSYNLMKVTRSLYRLTGQTKYLEYYERSLWNAILGSQDPQTGEKTYYQPLGSNSVKDFRSNEVGCYCCNGTGLENPPRSTAMIYAMKNDELRVQLFIPSTLRHADWGVTILQTTEFPMRPRGKLLVESKTPKRFTISVRVPSWTGTRGSLTVNGEAIDGKLVAGEFYAIEREWKSQDVIEYEYPFNTQIVAMPDDENQVAFVHGPLVMVGLGANDSRGWLELPFDRKDTQALQGWFKPKATGFAGGSTLDFEAEDAVGRKILFRPYYQVDSAAFFTGYWQLGKRPYQDITKERNLALGKPTECSTPEPAGSNLEAFMRSAKAVDGNYGGPDDWYVKWFPNGLSPQWIIVDLEQDESVSMVQWLAAKEDLEAKIAYRYRIDSSLDKTTWEPIADASENREFREVYEHTIPKRLARYIRLTTLPHPDLKDHQARPKIAEILVYGAK